MRLKFNGKQIEAILAVVPPDQLRFEDEISNYEFPPENSLKLQKTMGYNTHRIFDGGECLSDIAEFAFRYLFDSDVIDKNSIDAIIVVTETPDYIIPPTSNVIQGRLGMKEDMICLDINQGCAGFEVGMMQACMLLEQDSVNKVAIVNAEMLSRRVSRRDRNSFPLIGDACAITIVGKNSASEPIYMNIKMDGKGAFAIQIPAGGTRLPSSVETAEPQRDEYGNWRSLDNLVMKGDEVFMFVQKRVPPLINDILDFSGHKGDEIDLFMFHQPNKFMLNKLADKLKISRDRMPSNIVEIFGNSSGVTVPLNIAYNLADEITSRKMLICMAGFGVGLAWSSIVTETGPLKLCKLIEYNA